MGCSSCKKNSKIKDQIIDTTKGFEKGVIWFTIIWTLLGLYGIYSLISDIF